MCKRIRRLIGFTNGQHLGRDVLRHYSRDVEFLTLVANWQCVPP
jgi:hypothetical protein